MSKSSWDKDLAARLVNQSKQRMDELSKKDLTKTGSSLSSSLVVLPGGTATIEVESGPEKYVDVDATTVEEYNQQNLAIAHEDQISINKIVPLKGTIKFSDIPTHEIIQMMCDIYEKGLINPILVWDSEKVTDDNLYLLDGRMRLMCYWVLYELTKEERFAKIHVRRYSRSFARGGIDLKTAIAINRDSNWLSRDKTYQDKAMCIVSKWNEMKSTKQNSNTRGLMEKIAKYYGLEQAQAYNLRTVGERLIQEYWNMLNDNVITLGNAYQLAQFDQSTQKWLYDEHKDMINKKTVPLLKADWDKPKLEKKLKEIVIKQGCVEETVATITEPDLVEKDGLQWATLPLPPNISRREYLSLLRYWSKRTNISFTHTNTRKKNKKVNSNEESTDGL